MQPGGGGQGGMTGPGSGQWMQAGADRSSGLAGRLAEARNALQRAQIMGADPMTIQGLQSELSSLEQAAQIQMMQQQQETNTRMARGPGIGGASPYGASWQNENRNNDIQMQILASMFGMGGGGRGQGGGGLGSP